MKKLFSILLILSLIGALPLSAFAGNESDPISSLPMEATITNPKTGEIVPLTVKAETSMVPLTRSADCTDFKQTYSVSVAASGYDKSFTDSEYDSSSSVKYYITLYMSFKDSSRKYINFVKTSGYYDVMQSGLTTSRNFISCTRWGQREDNLTVKQYDNYEFNGSSFNFYPTFSGGWMQNQELVTFDTTWTTTLARSLESPWNVKIVVYTYAGKLSVCKLIISI